MIYPDFYYEKQKADETTNQMNKQVTQVLLVVRALPTLLTRPPALPHNPEYSHMAQACAQHTRARISSLAT